MVKEILISITLLAMLLTTLGQDSSCSFKLTDPNPDTNCVFTTRSIIFEDHFISPDSDSTLDSIVRFIKRNPELQVNITVHTMSIGSEEFNQELSELRAENLQDHLVQQGVSRKRIKCTGKGESQLLYDDEHLEELDDKELRWKTDRQNLRVEIHLELKRN